MCKCTVLIFLPWPNFLIFLNLLYTSFSYLKNNLTHIFFSLVFSIYLEVVLKNHYNISSLEFLIILHKVSYSLSTSSLWIVCSNSINKALDIFFIVFHLRRERTKWECDIFNSEHWRYFNVIETYISYFALSKTLILEKNNEFTKTLSVIVEKCPLFFLTYIPSLSISLHQRFTIFLSVLPQFSSFLTSSISSFHSRLILLIFFVLYWSAINPSFLFFLFTLYSSARLY